VHDFRSRAYTATRMDRGPCSIASLHLRIATCRYMRAVIDLHAAAVADLGDRSNWWLDMREGRRDRPVARAALNAR